MDQGLTFLYGGESIQLNPMSAFTSDMGLLYQRCNETLYNIQALHKANAECQGPRHKHHYCIHSPLAYSQFIA